MRGQVCINTSVNDVQPHTESLNSQLLHDECSLRYAYTCEYAYAIQAPAWGSQTVVSLYK